MRAARAVAAAWSLLTILPLPRSVSRRLEASDWARCGAAFPLVGLALGLLVAAIAHVGIDLLGTEAGAAVAVIASAILTAGLHLDGLADCADALGARGSGEAQRRRRLDILRDSATGAYGALALISALLLQTTTIASLSLAGATGMVVALTLALPLARTAGVVHAALLLPARRSGLGASFAVSRGALITALVGALLITGAISAAWVVDQHELRGLAEPVAALVGAAVAVAVTTRLAAAKLGGRTGDTIGATIVLAETLALLGFLAAR
ncbi:MAG: adenosylcobinamide-GDP ribazoletransferase [Solirubrobacteraceae bacterium]|nr:adenosylcobinamide-GDP ribazoletransferase [Solirubrobacteraceae bacterium]